MPHPGTRILFVTRDPVFHEQTGSTTYIQQLLQLLLGQGAEVLVLCTAAASRSPRLFFRQRVDPPAGVTLRYPGYLRVGAWYVRPWAPLPWLRLLSRVLARRRSPGQEPDRILEGLERLTGGALYTGTWDLTAPTGREQRLVARVVRRFRAETVVSNYCFWGPVLGALKVPRTAILMHDLLSARVRRFQASGAPLDMPAITQAEEMAWLSGADAVLAAQGGEAAQIQPLVSATVLTLPVVLEPRRAASHDVLEGRCLFVGSNIAPNQTALAFLVREVWPCVRASVPGAVLAVAGTVGRMLDGPDWSKQDLAGVQVLGVVPDLAVEYARAAVCCVPLQLGTGIKIKLLEALQHGKAVVSTTVGVEGLGPWVEDAILIADAAPDFVRGLLLVLRDKERRHAMEDAAQAVAQEHFGFDRALDPAFRVALFGAPAPGSQQIAAAERELALR